jgi:hypothetical protein
VWDCRKETVGRYFRFFLVSNLYIDLESYYRINFLLVHDHHFTMEAINEWIPWERDIYLILLKEWIKEEQERIQKEQSKYKMPSGGRRR